MRIRKVPIALALSILFVGCIAQGSSAPPEPASEPETPGPAEERAFGDSRLLAVAPDMWHIEGVAYHDGRVYAGTAFAATGDPVPLNNLAKPSRIFVWDRDSGDLVDTILVKGENTLRSHGITGLTMDAKGRLYALSLQLGVLRFTEKGDSWQQVRIAAIPDLKPCLLAPPPCSPTLRDEPGIPNDLTWGPDGSLFVSDSFQATIWRVTAENKIEIWFQHADLDRKFGANGLRISPDGTSMVLAVTGPDSAEAGPIERGSKIFSIPFPDPAAGDMEVLHTLPNGDLADGIAFGADGDLFVMSNAGDRLFVYPAEGGEPLVVGNDDLSGDGQMDFPASLAFDGTGALIIVNYAFSNGHIEPTARSVIDVFVGDVGTGAPTAPGIG